MNYRDDREKMRKQIDAMTPNPNPRIVALMDYAIDQISPRLSNNEKYDEWIGWAARWRSGERSPADCVNVANVCFRRNEDDPLAMWHTLGQLAWGAKEACYSSPKSGWLTVRYIADAMVAFGATFPVDGAELEAPTIDNSVSSKPLTISRP